MLTVIIPACNEAATIAELLERVARAEYDKQIVIVDDASTDGTSAIVEQWQASQTLEAVEFLAHTVNRGKGGAIRSALAAATGDIVLIQDADLEYDPRDYSRLIEPIVHGEADVVYGSRYLRRENRLPWTANRLCVHLLNLMVRVLYRRKITDEATCYKAFRADVLRRMDLRCERFEFCPEATAKVSRMGIRIHEVPIRYDPRTVREGKKIRWRDGIEAIWTLLYWRFAPFSPLEGEAGTRSTQLEASPKSATPLSKTSLLEG